MADLSLQQHLLAQHAQAVGAEGLAGFRSKAIGEFTDLGIPTPRDEDWKYTNLRALEKHAFVPATTVHGMADVDTIKALFIDALDSYRLVFINGQYSEALSAAQNLPAGIKVIQLRAALAQDANIAKLLGASTPACKHGLNALNAAFVDSGVYIEASENANLDKPIELLFVGSAPSETPLLVQPRNVIHAKAGSSVCVIERFVSANDERVWTNSVTEIFVDAGAKLTHYKLQEENTKSFHVGAVYAQQETGSAFESGSVALGALIARNDIAVTLDGENASCALNGLYVGAGRQHIDNHTQIHHTKPSCKSDEYYKGILDGRSRGVFHGRIVVAQDAQHTDSEQHNDNLLLSRDAEIDTKPQLEIYADDVKCAHGATVGQLDEESIFYLRSRGIDAMQARDLLTYAFAADVVSKIEIEAVRHHLEIGLSQRMLHGNQFAEVI